MNQRHKTMPMRLFGLTSFAVAAVGAGAGVVGATTPDEAGTDSVAAAEQAALVAAGGEEIGGSVSLLGVLGDAELEAFESVLAPFETATGVEVEYESTRDIGAVLQTRVDGGNPPDLAANPGVGQMIGFAEDGELVDVGSFLDAAVLAEQYDEALLGGISIDDHLYGIYTAVNLEGLIWYNPNTYTGPTAPASFEELQDVGRRDGCCRHGAVVHRPGERCGVRMAWSGVDHRARAARRRTRVPHAVVARRGAVDVAADRRSVHYVRLDRHRLGDGERRSHRRAGDELRQRRRCDVRRSAELLRAPPGELLRWHRDRELPRPGTDHRHRRLPVPRREYRLCRTSSGVWRGARHVQRHAPGACAGHVSRLRRGADADGRDGQLAVRELGGAGRGVPVAVHRPGGRDRRRGWRHLLRRLGADASGDERRVHRRCARLRR